MRDNLLQDVVEDDDFPDDGTIVSPTSGSNHKPNFSLSTTFSLFACLIVMVISAIFLICMFCGYV
ncbi:MAG: hypothetical protein ACPGMQ_02890 [Pirellulales bacterium]